MAKKLGNLSTRVIVGLIGIPLLVVLSLVGKIPFLILVLAIGLVSYFEFTRMMRNKHSYTNKLIGYLSVAVIIVNEYKPVIDYHLLLLLITVLLLLFELFRNKDSAVSNIGSTLFAMFYIGI